MSYIDKFRRLSYLLELIEKRRVSGLGEICSRFNCSDKTARRMINELRNEGHDLKFCRKLKKYLLTKALTVRK